MDTQKKRWRWATRVALLFTLAMTLAGCFDLSGQEGKTQSLDSPLPTPTAEPGVIIITPGEDRIEPTWTPWPTFTPRPTPTRRPGPTATAIPLSQPPDNAAGILIYGIREQNDTRLSDSWKTVLLDERGQVREAVVNLPQLNFIPANILPSPDGRYVLFMQAAEGGGIPFVYDWQTGQLWRPLERGREYNHTGVRGLVFAWHPDSKQMLFWADAIPYAGLWLVDVETGQRTVLALTDSPVQGAAISPDGQKVVYARQDGAFSPTYIWVVDAADGSPHLLTGELAGYVFGWSPDGAHILIAGGEVAEKSKEDHLSQSPSLWVINPDGKDYRPLSGPFLSGWGLRPIWSPNGQSIVFVGSIPGEEFGCAKQSREWSDDCFFQGTNLYVVNIYTGQLRRLIPGMGPVWSPDGSQIAFVSNQSGASEIWAINTDGSNLRQLTYDTQSKEFWLAWFQPRE